MDVKPNFSDYTRQLASRLNNGFCMIPGCTERAVDYHHRLSNTKLNNKKYPLFIQSIFNLANLCRKHHDDYGCFKWLKITDNQAEIYEQWLEDLEDKIEEQMHFNPALEK